MCDLPCFFFSISFRVSFALSSSRSCPISLRSPTVSPVTKQHEQVKYLPRFPPDLLVRLGLLHFLGSLLRPLLRHARLQLSKLLLLFFFREWFDLQDGTEYAFVGHDDKLCAYLLSGLLELIVTTLLCMVIRERSVLKYLSTLGALDTLSGPKRCEFQRERNLTRVGLDDTFASASACAGVDPSAPVPYTALKASRSSSSSIGSPPPGGRVEVVVEDTDERSGTGLPSFSIRWSIAGCSPRLFVALSAPAQQNVPEG